MDTVNVFLDAFGKFSVSLGVPYRNGIQKRRVGDVYITPLRSRSHNSPNYPSGATLDLTLEESFINNPEYCTMGKESFHIGSSILHVVAGQIFQAPRETGYKELYNALWLARKILDCECSSKLPATFELPAGCGALVVRYDDDFDFCKEDLVLCLTGGDAVARWRALIANHGGAIVLLRGKHCCLTCAMEQAFKIPGKCHLIL